MAASCKKPGDLQGALPSAFPGGVAACMSYSFTGLTMIVTPATFIIPILR
ncbi:MAG: hypothetical protein M3373_01310 [Gemmatimonadota bacterium]|nr:hypothetical protein [Gemmatimonadota bacterium]